jgi:hypothetical protein
VKAESFGVYGSKIKAYAKFIGVWDALDPILMMNCATRSEFVALDITRPDNLTLVKRYKANKRLGMIIALGQGTGSG